MIDFPNNPVANQVFTAPSGQTWMWDGMAWIQQTMAAPPATANALLSSGTIPGATNQHQIFETGVQLGHDHIYFDEFTGGLRLFKDANQMLTHFDISPDKNDLTLRSGSPPIQSFKFGLDTSQTSSPVGEVRLVSPFVNRGDLEIVFQESDGTETGVKFESGQITFQGGDIDAGGHKVFNIQDATNPQDAVALHQLSSKEDDLGLPAQTGMMLVSTAGGVRSWIATSGAPDYTGVTPYATAQPQLFQEGVALSESKKIEWANLQGVSRASITSRKTTDSPEMKLLVSEDPTVHVEVGAIILEYKNKAQQSTSITVDNNGLSFDSNVPGGSFNFNLHSLSSVSPGINPNDVVTVGQLSAKEDLLGSPAADGMVLVSTTAGVRTWTNLARPDYTGATAYATIQSQSFAKGITIPQEQLLNIGGGELWTDAGGNVELIHIDPADAGSVRLISRGTHTSDIYVSPNGIGIQSSYANAVVNFNSLKLHAIADGTLPQDAVSLSQLDTKEDSLGNPATDGMVLASTAAGVRSWAAAPTPDLSGYLPIDGSAVGATTQKQVFTNNVELSNDLQFAGLNSHYIRGQEGTGEKTFVAFNDFGTSKELLIESKINRRDTKSGTVTLRYTSGEENISYITLRDEGFSLAAQKKWSAVTIPHIFFTLTDANSGVFIGPDGAGGVNTPGARLHIVGDSGFILEPTSRSHPWKMTVQTGRLEFFRDNILALDFGNASSPRLRTYDASGDVVWSVENATAYFPGMSSRAPTGTDKQLYIDPTTGEVFIAA